jgi:predicted nucleotidyltransferase
MSFEKLKARWKREQRKSSEEARARREALLDKGALVFERYRIERVFIFGSLARGTSRADSDIDLLVFPLDQTSYWDFRRDLQEVLEYEIDLYTQADDPTLVKKIQEHGELIYDAQHGRPSFDE